MEGKHSVENTEDGERDIARY